MAQLTLSIRNLTKTFGDFKAVNNVSIDVEKSKITLMIGPNGSGKTTLINCITGFYNFDEGEIFFYGENVNKLKTHELVEKGLVRTFQIPSPFKRLTVLENLLVSYGNNPGEHFICSLFNKKWINKEEYAMEKAYEVLELLEITDLADNLAYALSGGQLKLLEMGRALMTDAKMILTDEPAGSVSVPIANKIFSHIYNLNKKMGVDFLIIEHRLDIASKYVDYIYAMNQGRVVAKGEPAEVLENTNVLESYLSVRKC